MATDTITNTTIDNTTTESQVEEQVDNKSILLNMYNDMDLLNKAFSSNNEKAIEIIVNSVTMYNNDEQYKIISKLLDNNKYDLIIKLIEQDKISEKYLNELLLNVCYINHKVLFDYLMNKNIDVNYVALNGYFIRHSPLL